MNMRMTVAVALLRQVLCSRFALSSAWILPVASLFVAQLSLASNQFQVIYGLDGTNDGADPYGGVIQSGNMLFGTSVNGGAEQNGTVWSLNTSSDVFSKLHDFDSRQNGTGPDSVLAVNEDFIFGTTLGGGLHDEGTIWSINKSSGAHSVLHELKSEIDGEVPRGRVILVGDILYGTAEVGGENNAGTIWSLDTRNERFMKLHSFSKNIDGEFPFGVVESDDVLYGITRRGGNGPGVTGTIWSFDTVSGIFTNLHAFRETVDGGVPTGITISENVLYGATFLHGQKGAGTIWSFDVASGIFSNLYDFDRATDGYEPLGGVVVSQNTVFGTNSSGGVDNAGVVWALELDSGALKILHEFVDSSDGSYPSGSIALDGNKLYGTNVLNGPNNSKGTIWSLVVPEPSSALLFCMGSLLFFILRK